MIKLYTESTVAASYSMNIAKSEITFCLLKQCMNAVDSAMVCLIYFVSLCQRLWFIQFPECIVFDEVHFGGFVNCYLNGTFFLDIHPPFAKMVFACIAKLAQYDYSIDFDKEDYIFGDEFYVFLRMSNAIISSFCFPLIYTILRRVGISIQTSLCISILGMCETSFVTQHRFILIDGILHFSVLLYLVCLLSKKSFITRGMLLGISYSCKLTSLSLIPFRVSCEFIELSSDCVYEIIISVITFLSLTLLNLLFLPGASCEAELLLPQALYNDLFANRSLRRVLLATVPINIVMHNVNMKNRKFHPYQSHPFSWPLFTGIWVRMWDDGDDGREINCLGNVFVLLPVFFLQFGCVFVKKHIFLVGWAFSYFPFVLIPRSMFFYHYQIPLLFGLLSSAFVLEKCPLMVRFLIISFAIFGFVYWSPFVYGCGVIDRSAKIWNRAWSTGGDRHRNLVEAFFGIHLE